MNELLDKYKELERNYDAQEKVVDEIETLVRTYIKEHHNRNIHGCIEFFHTITVFYIVDTWYRVQALHNGTYYYHAHENLYVACAFILKDVIDD